MLPLSEGKAEESHVFCPSFSVRALHTFDIHIPSLSFSLCFPVAHNCPVPQNKLSGWDSITKNLGFSWSFQTDGSAGISALLSSRSGFQRALQLEKGFTR